MKKNLEILAFYEVMESELLFFFFFGFSALKYLNILLKWLFVSTVSIK